MKTKIDKESIIITIYVTVVEICERMLEKPPQKQKLNDAEIK